MYDQEMFDKYAEELLEMMDECPFQDFRLTAETGCHRCANGDKPYCITAVVDDICCNEEILSFLEEKAEHFDDSEEEESV